MKTTATFRFIIAAMTAISVFSSCRKEPAVEGNPGTAEENQGLRTITLQFSPGTKAAFDGIKSSFVNGDVIKLSNGTKSADATVSVANGVASITTSLTGNLTAVYPSTAANVTGTGPIGTPAYKVPSVQDGTPEKAVIAVANITSPTAVFEFQPALFQITPPSGATSITIKSLNTIDATGRRSTTANAAFINTTGADNAAKREITVNVTGGKAYAALVPGVKLTDLSFDAGETVGMKGIPESTVTSRATALGKTLAGLNVVAIGNAYQIDNSNWHPYVTINGLKWATMNIGANSPTEYGYYFMWGGTVGYKRSGSDWVMASNTSSVLSGGFNKNNDPHYSDSSYTKYTSDDKKTVLELADDAAYANWGGLWRMPTKEDFTELAKECFLEWTENYNSTGVKGVIVWKAKSGDAGWFKPSTAGKGCKIKDDGSRYNTAEDHTFSNTYAIGTDALLFFPVAGFGYNTSLRYATDGLYWSSSLSFSSISAYSLNFNSSYVAPQSSNIRFYGISVRPVSN